MNRRVLLNLPNIHVWKELMLSSFVPSSVDVDVPRSDKHPFSIAAGQNTTLLLAKPNEQLSELPRHPEDVRPPESCIKCHQDNGEDDSLLECDKVRSRPFPFFLKNAATMRLTFSATPHVTWLVSTLRWRQSLMESGSAPTASKTQVPPLACPVRKERRRKARFTNRQGREQREKVL
jgi:hypothetical protein